MVLGASRASGTPGAHGADVDIRAITKRFGAVVAVEAVSFTVRAGEFFSLLGPSGCGKTTTLRAIGGFETVDEGDILIGGRAMGRLPPNHRATNMVFQRLALFPHYSVFDNVAFGLRMRRLAASEVARRVAEALSRVDLGALGGRRIGELSGGQQQRVALARALVNEPRVLLLDEPLSALDLKLRIQLQEELKRLQRGLGTTFIYVTHDQGEALAMSDRIGVMSGGRLEQVGTPLEIYERPATRFVAGFIGDANLVEAVVEAVDGDYLVARVGDARVRARRQGGEHVGAGLTVCVRPERVQVTRADGQGHALAGHVEDRAFSGSLVKYRVAVPGLRLHAAVPYIRGTRLFEVGDAVAVAWDGDQAVTVPA